MTIFSSIVLFHGFGYGRINLRFFVGSDNIALQFVGGKVVILFAFGMDKRQRVLLVDIVADLTEAGVAGGVIQLCSGEVRPPFRPMMLRPMLRVFMLST